MERTGERDHELNVLQQTNEDTFLALRACGNDGWQTMGHRYPSNAPWVQKHHHGYKLLSPYPLTKTCQLTCKSPMAAEMVVNRWDRATVNIRDHATSPVQMPNKKKPRNSRHSECGEHGNQRLSKRVAKNGSCALRMQNVSCIAPKPNKPTIIPNTNHAKPSTPKKSQRRNLRMRDLGKQEQAEPPSNHGILDVFLDIITCMRFRGLNMEYEQHVPDSKEKPKKSHLSIGHSIHAEAGNMKKRRMRSWDAANFMTTKSQINRQRIICDDQPYQQKSNKEYDRIEHAKNPPCQITTCMPINQTKAKRNGWSTTHLAITKTEQHQRTSECHQPWRATQARGSATNPMCAVVLQPPRVHAFTPNFTTRPRPTAKCRAMKPKKRKTKPTELKISISLYQLIFLKPGLGKPQRGA